MECKWIFFMKNFNVYTENELSDLAYKINNCNQITPEFIISQLDVSTTYFHNNIRSFLNDKIILTSNILNTLKNKSLIKAQKKYSHVFFNNTEYYELLQNNITITQQTIVLPEKMFVQPTMYVAYSKACREFNKKILPALKKNNYSEAKIKEKKFKTVILKNMEESKQEKLLRIFNDIPKYNKRTETPIIDLTYNKDILNYVLKEIKEGRALSIQKLKDKLNISSNEEIYRNVFNTGKIKIELNFAKKNTDSKKANKVLFVEPPIPILLDRTNQINLKHKSYNYIIKIEHLETLKEILNH